MIDQNHNINDQNKTGRSDVENVEEDYNKFNHIKYSFGRIIM